MLTRLLSNIDGVKACLLSREGEIVGGDGGAISPSTTRP
ncbi:MAG: hypothetical protein Ct9H90mP16_10700 [Candidatus Poseidoniales archaeon]|nr:MAG: hypothetical protein Ct9H90mP16_10700 [Candidatus Poseidoniales archaeon]